MKNEKEQFISSNGKRTLKITVFETKKQVLFNMSCSIPGPIPDGPDLDHLLDETIAAYEGDPRRLVLVFGGRSAVVRFGAQGGALIAFGPTKGKVAK